MRYLLVFLAFLVSCSDFERENPLDPKAVNYIDGELPPQDGSSSSVTGGGDSSSSGKGSSSSVGGLSSSLGSSSSVAGQNSSSSAGGSSSSVVNSSSSSIGNSSIEFGALEYEGYTYKTVKIGTQWWFAENLNYDALGSRCYNDVDDNCTKYGRLYDWAMAMDIDWTYNTLSYNGTAQRGICPEGWRIPSNTDWDKLFRYVDGNTSTSSPYMSSIAGGKLKATNLWISNGNGTDDFGFSALPGGYGYYNSNYELKFSAVSSYGRWWSANQDDCNEELMCEKAYYRVMCECDNFGSYGNIEKTRLYSVRCVKD